MIDEYLHCQHGTSDKVYSLHVRPTDRGHWVVIGFWGSRTQAMRNTLSTRGAVRIHANELDALDDAYGVRAGKLAKQYRPCHSSVVWPHGIDPLLQSTTVSHSHCLSLAGTGAASPATPSPPQSSTTGLCSPCLKARDAQMQAAKAAQMKAQAMQKQCTKCGTWTLTITMPSFTGQWCAPCMSTIVYGRTTAEAPPAHGRTTAEAPPAPGWILACFAELPALSRSQAADILSGFFPDLAPAIVRVAAAPAVSAPTKVQAGTTYCVAALTIGQKIHVPGLGFFVNGQLTAAQADILMAAGTPVVPHVWTGEPWHDPDDPRWPKKPAAAPAPLVQTVAVDWMRAVFSRTPIDARKSLYRQFTKVVHEDISGDVQLHQRWIETYARYAPP